jgi:hypothetical protein
MTLALLVGGALLSLGACQTTVEEDDDDGAGGSSGATTTTTVASVAATTTGGGVGLPVSCWNGLAECHPLTNEPCAAGETCDAGVDMTGNPAVTCYPPPNTQAVGQACDAAQGPFCQGGSTCVQGVCAQLCCSAADCTGGLPCTPFDPAMGTLGACAEAPMCSGPGGPCVDNADCCSNDCHVVHCH